MKKLPPKEAMTRAAARLLAEKGLAGTSFSEVIEASGAPRGSIYHHFPDGKDALAAEAIALVGNSVIQLLQQRDLATPGEVVRRLIGAFRASLVKSDFRAGCAIAAVANERIANPALGAKAAATFAAWQDELAAALAAVGAKEPAGSATLVIAALEGALVLCRAGKTVAPLDRIEAALVAYV